MEEAVTKACRKAGRPRDEIRLMAVSKTHPLELLIEAAAAGQRLFGENRVQEFGDKTQALAETPYAVDLRSQALLHKGPENLRPSKPGHVERSEGPAVPRATPQVSDEKTQHLAVHLIGHLQSNKAARAAELFTAVDTLDSLKLANRLHDAAQCLGRTLPVLIEIKLSPEATKEGLAPDSPELLALLERLPDLNEHLPLNGLMTVAPISDDPEVARTCFRRLHRLRERLAQQHPHLRFDELSMGMSGDFEAAVEEGSTTIRIGTAIFGARPKPA